jgi:replicative DNA helicase
MAKSDPSAPPADLDAEMSVVGSIILDPNSIDEIIESLKPEHFYRENYGHIYNAAMDLYREGVGIDNVTLAERLSRMEAGNGTTMLERVGGRTTLASMQQAVPTSANIAHYAAIVRDKATRRRLIKAAVDITKSAYDESHEADDVVQDAQATLFAVAEDEFSDRVTMVDHVLSDVMKQYDERKPGELSGLATGFVDLDRKLNGLKKGEVYIVAARPAMGKTSWALQVARHVSKQGVIPVIFSLEMSNDQIVTRLLCQEARIDAQKFERHELNDEDWEKVARATGPLGDAKIIVDDSARLDELKMLHRTRVLQRRHNIGLVVIDYVQLLEARHSQPDNRVAEVTAISRALKAMARDLEIPVLAVSQLNRSPEARRGDHRPLLSDLRESGAIEQDAAAVAFLFRPEYYKPGDRPGICEVIVSKNRFGPTGTIDLAWRREFTRFENTTKLPGYVPQ